ncbi:MAG: hypothetical protein BBJ57_10855 [Desulfobacterales bacterium PC51MH44]|nr:MAG: hypothetical protein BBJ57_10855 [Desulfobacterales bacterium PC51MH44]
MPNILDLVIPILLGPLTIENIGGMAGLYLLLLKGIFIASISCFPNRLYEEIKVNNVDQNLSLLREISG